MPHILDRGESDMKQREGKIIATYHFGATTVYVNDAFVAKTEEERNRVLENIRRAAMAIVEEEAMRKLEEE